jgi:hypothetical protein
MNLFQAANGAATFLILSAVVAGLAKRLDSENGDPLRYLLFEHRSIIYLGFFIVVFRIKTLLDDHRHFAELNQDKTTWRYIGFVLAVISWLFWALAGYDLPNTTRAAEFMATSILVSTCWVVVHLIEILLDPARRNSQAIVSIMREKWVLLNIAYILCLVAHVGWFEPLVATGSTSPLGVLLVALLFDILTSRSYRNVVSAPTGHAEAS